MSLKCVMYLGDCLDVMLGMPTSKFNMVFADLPYGTTYCPWDRAISIERLWERLKVICADNAAKLFTCVQPFTTTIASSNVRELRYDLVWQKSRATGFLNAKRMPLRGHETILVFYKKLPTYNAQRRPSPNKRIRKSVRSTPTPLTVYSDGTAIAGNVWEDSSTRHPVSVINVPSMARSHMRHPTQKPVALLDWLVCTYTNAGDYVLDPAGGSGTSAVSALAKGRHVAIIEKETVYFEQSLDRIRRHIRDNNIDATVEVRR